MDKIIDFYHGARPKTLSAAIAPVVLGTVFAWELGTINVAVSILCLVVAVSLQIGVNYANDYSDGVKGTDDNRVGPMRLVGSGAASAKSVLIAMWISFGVTGIAGLIVSIYSTLFFIPVGAICIVLAWFYTGGKHPYGYYGFGELVVFICFGFIATVGTFLANVNPASAINAGKPFVFSWIVVIAGCIPGLYSVAILLANNIRDIQTDTESKKKTLAVRLGCDNSIHLYSIVHFLIVLSTVAIAIKYPFVWASVIIVFITSIKLVKALKASVKPPEYITVLVLTSKMNLISALMICFTIIMSSQLFGHNTKSLESKMPIKGNSQLVLRK